MDKNKFIEEKVFLNYASICQHQKKSKDAILLLRQSIKINPKEFTALYKSKPNKILLIDVRDNEEFNKFSI